MPATLSAPIKDSPAGKSLDSISSIFASSLEDGLKNGVSDPDAIAEDKTLETAKVEVQPDANDGKAAETTVATKKDEKKPDPKGETKAEPAKDQPKEVKDAPKEKGGQKLSELPKDQQDFVLLASQKRQLEAFERITKERDAIRGELDPLKAKVAELEGLTKDAPKELETLRAENDRLKSENSEFNGKITAYDVKQTREYKTSVQEPWDRDVVGVLNEMSYFKDAEGNLKETGFNGAAAYQAIQAGDRASLNALSATLDNDLDKQALADAFRQAKGLMAKHQEYTAKAGDALKVIKERQTTAEKQASERANAEVKGIGANLSKQVAVRFPFLNGVEGDDHLNDALKKAQAEMERFDVVNATLQERAEAAHARAYAPVIAARQEMIIQDQQRQLAAKDEEHAKVETELREQIAGLEERLGNLNGETAEVQPGKRDAQGRFQPEKKIEDVWKKSMAGIR